MNDKVKYLFSVKPGGYRESGGVYDADGIAPTVKENHGEVIRVLEPTAIRFARSEEMKARRKVHGDTGVKFQGKVPELRPDGCSNTVTSFVEDNLIIQRVGDLDNPSLSVKDTAFTVCSTPKSDRQQFVVEVLACAVRGRADGEWFASDHNQRLELGGNISNSITSVQKDNMVVLAYSRDCKGNICDRHIKDIANTLTESSGSGNTTDQFIIDYD